MYVGVGVSEGVCGRGYESVGARVSVGVCVGVVVGVS